MLLLKQPKKRGRRIGEGWRTLVRQHPRKLTAEDLDSLLSGGRLSGPTKDRILNAVLKSTTQQPWFSGWPARDFLPWLLAPTALAVALLATALSGVWSTAPSIPDFQARGVGAPGPMIEAACAGPCKIGELLILRAKGIRESAYVAAYSVGPHGQRIWYFPTTSGSMPNIAPTTIMAALPQGVRLGAEHEVGTYLLHAIFLRTPLSRDAVLQLTNNSKPEAVVALAEAAFEVAP